MLIVFNSRLEKSYGQPVKKPDALGSVCTKKKVDSLGWFQWWVIGRDPQQPATPQLDVGM